jgi:transcriptional regulator with XRE-family HTH domain
VVDVEGEVMTAIDVPNRRGDLTPLGRWCRERRISYERLGRQVGLSRRQVILIATGVVLPSGFATLALASATGLPLTDLLGGVLAVEASSCGPIAAVAASAPCRRSATIPLRKGVR